MTTGSFGLYRRDGRLRGCYVYMLFCQDTATVYIKIGIAAEPVRRLAALITACPIEPREFGWIEAPGRQRALTIERTLHRICKPWRIRGEWFAVPIEARDEFRKLTTEVLDGFRDSAWPLKWSWLSVPEFLVDARQRRAARFRGLKHRTQAYWDAVGAGLEKDA